jgi:Clp amino terminal domain, pathogenicity island component
LPVHRPRSTTSGRQVETHTTFGEKTPTSLDLPVSEECKRVLLYAWEEAEALAYKHIGTEHLLLGILREQDCYAAQLLNENGVALESTRAQVAGESRKEVASYASPVTASALKEGEVYFSVQFADEQMLIPIVETWVFAGRKLNPQDAENRLYFQDVESYLQGIRHGFPAAETARFQVAIEENTKHIFEYEHALEELMRCSLRRRKQTR